MEKKFPNNWAWPGVTALMYNVDMSKYFDWNDSTSEAVIKEDYLNALSDIGFQWKKSSASSWVTVSLKDTNSTYIQDEADVKGHSGDAFLGTQYVFSQGGGVDEIVAPLLVIIMESSSGVKLEANTSYDLRMYGVVGGTTEYYNSQTIKTLEDTAEIDATEIEYDEDAPEENIEHFRQELPAAIEDAITILRMFCNGVSETFNPKTIYDPYHNWAAKATMEYNSFYTSEDSKALRSVTIHEVGHRWMYSDGNSPEASYKDLIMKFMEFATGMGQAMWRWQGLHNYPIISSARYSFSGDCLVVAAYQLRYTWLNE